MKKILLTQGKMTVVDDDMFEYLNQWKWYLTNHGNTHYVSRKANGKSLYMHRVILNTPQGMLTDHRDGNSLNNLRSNLRIADQSLNQHNQHKLYDNKSSKYRGVDWHKKAKKWRARICIRGKIKHLGIFDNEEDAREEYKSIKRQILGDYDD